MLDRHRLAATHGAPSGVMRSREDRSLCERLRNILIFFGGRAMDPFKEFTHGGTLKVAEILVQTRFDYMFPLLAAKPECLLPPGATTQGCLLSLGTAMASDTLANPGDLTIPAVYTYLGQFIDHNITAQTDREIGASRIATPDGNVMDIAPLSSHDAGQETRERPSSETRSQSGLWRRSRARDQPKPDRGRRTLRCCDA